MVDGTLEMNLPDVILSKRLFCRVLRAGMRSPATPSDCPVRLRFTVEPMKPPLWIVGERSGRVYSMPEVLVQWSYLVENACHAYHQ